jgi:hypothetical protein
MTEQKKLLCSDHGGEFLSDKFKDHLAKGGMKHELTVHDSPQQDGVSKGAMRTCTEHARALLLASSLSRYLWAEAMLHSVRGTPLDLSSFLFFTHSLPSIPFLSSSYPLSIFFLSPFSLLSIPTASIFTGSISSDCDCYGHSHVM